MCYTIVTERERDPEPLPRDARRGCRGRKAQASRREFSREGTLKTSKKGLTKSTGSVTIRPSKEVRETKSRKVLRITFPASIDQTLFAWDGYLRGYKATHESLTVTLVEIQRRTERRDLARVARVIYGATTETLVR